MDFWEHELESELSATNKPSVFQDLAAVFALHAFAKTVCTDSLFLFGLIRSLGHGCKYNALNARCLLDLFNKYPRWLRNKKSGSFIRMFLDVLGDKKIAQRISGPA